MCLVRSLVGGQRDGVTEATDGRGCFWQVGLDMQKGIIYRAAAGDESPESGAEMPCGQLLQARQCAVLQAAGAADPL